MGLKKTMIKKTIGVYAPLTARDNVMVDNVLDMCYSQIDSQATAHWAFDPVGLLWSHSLRSSHRCS